jgi:hypothetical protein
MKRTVLAKSELVATKEGRHSITITVSTDSLDAIRALEEQAFSFSGVDANECCSISITKKTLESGRGRYSRVRYDALGDDLEYVGPTVGLGAAGPAR